MRARLSCAVAFAALLSFPALAETPSSGLPTGSPAAVADKARPDRAVAVLGGYVEEDGVFRPLAPAVREVPGSRPANAPPSFSFESVFQRIPRYRNSVIVSLTEYNPQNCAPIDPGKWTITHLEKFGTATTGSFTGHPTSGPCTGSTYTFAAIYFIWNKHTNETQRADTRGPIDTFFAEWKTDDGIYDILYSIDVNVPVVRPKGETNAFESWNEGKGRWRVTLVPPDIDPTFNFTGEKIRETYVSESDGCVGAGSSKSNVTTVKNGPPGNFGDSVGFSACAVEYARAKKRTPCGYRITQKMEISAPSDNGAFTQYGGLNTLIATVTGRLIDQNEGQHSIGTVTSQRVTPLSSPRPVPQGMATSRVDCLRGGLLGLQLMSEF